jgi:ribose transport system substrate-binding protein
MNKNFAAVGIGVLAIATLAGCANSGSPGAGSSTSGSKSYKMNLTTGVKGSPFYEAMACGAQAEAKKLGVKLTTSAPDQFDASQMAPLLDSVTAQHPDAELVVPVDKTALNSNLTQMKAAGIKIVELDQTVSDNSLVVSRIASNDSAGGKLGADTLAKEIGDKGKVLVITAPPGSAAQDARTAAFVKELKKYPKISYLGAQYQNDDVTKSASIITSTFAAHPDLAGVFSTNDIGAEGAVTGLKQIKQAGKIKLVAYDADAEEATELKADEIQAIIAQDPYTEGVTGVEQAEAALSGKKVTAAISTPLVSITAADTAKIKRYTYKGC